MYHNHPRHRPGKPMTPGSLLRHHIAGRIIQNATGCDILRHTTRPHTFILYMAFSTAYSISNGICTPLQWRHIGRASVSNHQPHDCLLNWLFRRRSKKTSKLRVTGLCARNSPGTGEFPAQMASYAENVSIWWRHHVLRFVLFWPCRLMNSYDLLSMNSRVYIQSLAQSLYELHVPSTHLMIISNKVCLMDIGKIYQESNYNRKVTNQKTCAYFRVNSIIKTDESLRKTPASGSILLVLSIYWALSKTRERRWCIFNRVYNSGCVDATHQWMNK